MKTFGSARVGAAEPALMRDATSRSRFSRLVRTSFPVRLPGLTHAASDVKGAGVSVRFVLSEGAITFASRSRGEQGVHLTHALLQPLDRAHVHDSLHVLAGLERHAHFHARAALVLDEPNRDLADRRVLERRPVGV